MGAVERMRRVRERLRRARHPSVTITDPPAGVIVDGDVAVPMRDGVTLRANVFRPAQPGTYPVIVCAHPYGKDRLPRPRRRGGWTVPPQYRALPQDETFSHSAWTSWEAPDPAHWVPRGYVLVNADLRGWGRSEGTGELFSPQEGADGHDLIEWAAAQPWSTGRVGMTGVSYLAIVQWRIAATRPPHLAAICPWEGFTDLYRDFAFPGGIREDGFSVMWNTLLSVSRRRSAGLRRLMRRHPLLDEAWHGRNPPLAEVEVPALVCASFSDQNLHSRGSFRGFSLIGSADKRLYTHRGPKWATYYSAPALAAQEAFFEEHLRGGAPEAGAPVRLEVRSDRRTVAAVSWEGQWPPADLRPHTVWADAVTSGLSENAPQRVALRRTRGGEIRFAYRFDADTDVIGPMRLRALVSVEHDDLTLFARVDKRSGGRLVTFEGSYGFTRDAVAHGWLRASHRAEVSEDPLEHPHDRRVAMPPDRSVLLELELLPSATRFAAGDELVLTLGDRWPYAANPVTGAFPARYQHTRRQVWAVHTGPADATSLTFTARPAIS